MYELLPESVVVLLPTLSLLFVGITVEKHYVSRVTCFTNSLALVVHYLTIGESGPFMRLHANLGIILGVLGFWAYLQSKSLPEFYYALSFLGYSSLVVGSIILYPQADWLLTTALSLNIPFEVFVAIAALLNIVLMDDKDNLVYMGAQPVDVRDFIDDHQILVPDSRGQPTWVSLEYWFDD